MTTFIRCSEIQATAQSVFRWHKSPDALKKLIPPWESVTVEKPAASLADGETAILLIRAGPLKVRWVARHRDLIDRGENGGEFTEEQD